MVFFLKKKKIKKSVFIIIILAKRVIKTLTNNLKHKRFVK
jgi:hypothetical protein